MFFFPLNNYYLIHPDALMEIAVWIELCTILMIWFSKILLRWIAHARFSAGVERTVLAHSQSHEQYAQEASAFIISALGMKRCVEIKWNSA